MLHSLSEVTEMNERFQLQQQRPSHIKQGEIG